MHKLILLDEKDTKKFLTMSEALKATEFTFQCEAEGKAVMPCKIYLNLPQHKGDFRAMPAYIDKACGIKWVSAYPNNFRRNLRAISAIIIYSDPETGYPLAVIDGTYITNMRTGAAGAIAAKYLARKNSTTLGLVGAGEQARTQLIAVKETFPNMDKVMVFGKDNTDTRLAQEMSKALTLNIQPVKTIEEAVKADIVITTTPSRQPLVKSEWILPGTHINAIGADAKGKQELAPELLKKARIVVDSKEQACHSGEMNVPLSQGIIGIEDIAATLGEVVTGFKQVRESDDDITIFDSTGLAIQDIVVARTVLENALKSGQVVSVDWS
ncbi:Delta(1)-pyrroline-2-carboxylate reductase [subsurface metagenome]